MPALPSHGQHPSRRKLTGRVAAATHFASGLLAIGALFLPISPDLDRGGALAVATIPLVLGLVAWFLPWARWPWWASLPMVAAGFLLLGAGNYFGSAPYTGVFFVMIFAWIGMGYGRWMSLRFARYATLCYVVPILLGEHHLAVNVSSAAITIPVSVLVGEAFGWCSTELRRVQRALRDGERRVSEAFERERTASQRLRALDEMKNTFLQAVSHELRTPLTAILGNSLTLEQSGERLSAEVREDLAHRTSANARKLERLLTDLLDVDRLQRGIVLAERCPTDIADLVATVVESYPALPHRSIQVDAEHVIASVDAAKVERIVENLLSNAVKYTPFDAPVWLRVAATHGGVLICVDDSGPGVSDDLKEAIFEPFHRGSQSRHLAPGTGIGLTLVARFSELHGGRAWVEDREGGGSSFRVFLPADESDDYRELQAAAAG